jgi:predicted esterase
MMSILAKDDPHSGQPILSAGSPLAQARGAMLLVHGRGASAGDILTLASEFNRPDFAYLAPQAAGNTWYPERFLAPIEQNEPWLSSALALLDRTLAQIKAAGFPLERTILLGFSQGACLALEFAARYARRYGGVAGLTGSLIGPANTPRAYSGSLDGTPVFLGCSDVDYHIPKERVVDTAEVMEHLGGAVTVRFYPGMGHTVNRDEIEFVTGMMPAMEENT